MSKQSRSRRRWWLGLAGLILIGAALKWFLFPSVEPPRLATAPVVLSDLEETVLATGTLEAFEQVSVGAQASGQIKSLKVALGDQVKQGQLVAEIDSLTQQNSLRTAEAALAQVRAQLKAKQATLRQAELELKRQRQMRDKEASSQLDLESAEATLNVTRAEIAALEAQIESASIAVSTAKVNLAYTKITSPIDGVVVAIVNKQGQTVNAAQTAPTIIKVAKLDVMTVKAQISEADVIRVKPGQKVYFTILGDSDHRYEATLRGIEPAPDSINSESSSTSSSSSASSSSSSTSGSSTSSAIYYNGLFEVDNPDGRLRISMTAQVSIVLAEARAALTIPTVALGDRLGPDRFLVQVLGQDQTPRAQEVRVGIGGHSRVQILEGLREGQQVVVGDAKAIAGNQNSDGPRRGPPMGF